MLILVCIIGFAIGTLAGQVYHYKTKYEKLREDTEREIDDMMEELERLTNIKPCSCKKD